MPNGKSGYKIISKLEKKYFVYCELEKDGTKYFGKFLKTYSEDQVASIRNEKEKCSLLANFLYIPKITDISHDYYYIIYEYIDGYSLNYYKNESLSNTLEIFVKILECVKQIHKFNIIHCDIKNSNIFINGDQVYIIDFGNATFLGEIAQFGSYPYCSVEQLKKKKASYHFDIYSLACVLYQMITGNLAFEMEDSNKILEKKQKGFPIIENTNTTDYSKINIILQKMSSNGYLGVEYIIEDIKELLTKV